MNLAARIAFSAALLLLGSRCGDADRPVVVVYTALDELYSRPILDAFESATGIDVLAVYDTEASKTTGLVNRLLAERDRPRADVFWNNETAQTIRLQHENALAPYASPVQAEIPAAYRDPDDYWTGFAARARVIIYNTELVSEPPTSILDLTDPKWRGRAAIANPLFGTTATHAGALFALWGDDRAASFFRDLNENGVAVLPGNAAVRDRVARGDFAWGLTDTDDANGAVVDGFPVAWLFPDQEADGLGTLLIPNTVALISGAPHAETGKRLIDYLLSPGVETALAHARSMQIPLNASADAPDATPNAADVRTMPVNFGAIADAMPRAAQFTQREFLR